MVLWCGARAGETMRSWDYVFCVLLSFTWILIRDVKCQLMGNAPPTLQFDRNWQIPETEKVGTVITRVRGSDSEGGSLEFGLEPLQFGAPDNNKKPERLPFRIDPVTGVVYLNESLVGRGGQDIHLYVTAWDGEVPAKTEVYVNILSANKTTNPSRAPFQNRPTFLNPFQYNSRAPPSVPNNPPPNIANNPPPLPSRKPPKAYPEAPPLTSTPQSRTYPEVQNTHLAPIPPLPPELPKSTNVVENEVVTAEEEKRLEQKLGNVEQPVKSAADLTVTLVPVLSVCMIFLVVGIVALALRRRNCLGSDKSSKDDMRKESSNGIVLQDTSRMALHDWGGPRALSNRYEPWERDAPHIQATNQSSLCAKTGDRWEFPRHRLKFFNILGEGAFGQVWKCEALDIDGSGSVSIVAVKTLKENATDKERADLIAELQIMKMLEPHPNVVKLLGSCTEKEPIFLIMEFVSRGKLQSYLRSSRAERYYNNMHGQSKTLTSRDLTSFVYQVAKGMEFLSAKGIIHRDLAARNVLITEDHTCMVADFGFARDVNTSHVYERKSEGRLPIRWMAPESLYDNIFSVKSDVWSFGVLIWEVVTLGSTPYPGFSAAEVMKKVKEGYRLAKPEHCRRELYNIMYYCWDKDAKQRPTFTECVELLEKLLMTETDYIELERFPDHSYYNMMSLSGEKL